MISQLFGQALGHVGHVVGAVQDCDRIYHCLALQDRFELDQYDLIEPIDEDLLDFPR